MMINPAMDQPKTHPDGDGEYMPVVTEHLERATRHIRLRPPAQPAPHPPHPRPEPAVAEAPPPPGQAQERSLNRN